MSGTVQLLILLLVVLAAVGVAARRLNTPPAILLVLVGAALALTPGLPAMELAPDVVLLLILPPVIYWSAVAMSWREFRFNLRPIVLLAVGCVIFSALAVAAALHWLLGLPLLIGFVVGAIVSPPDAVAPLSIARRMHLPRRIIVVLEGEGLANDATALILYRFAVVAVSFGTFSLPQAVGTFAMIVVGEIFWGVGVGWAMLHLRKWVKDPSIEITLSLITPFLAYWPPEYLGGSGVLATVTAGLYVSWNGPNLISSATRLQGIFFGGFLMYLIEGMIFLITGLQARTLAASLGGYSAFDLASTAIVVCLVLIAARFIWIYPTVYLPRLLIPALRRADPSPPWQWPFILSFTGVRGIVSLAAALAIPFTVANGAPFPERDLILFVTFTVILVTLVVQGLLLPVVIRLLNLADAGRRERALDHRHEQEARQEAITAALECLDQLVREDKLSDELVRPIRAEHRERLRHIENRTRGDESHRKQTELHEEIEAKLIAAERQRINELYRAGKIIDEARRRIERELDLREAQLANPEAETPDVGV
jgi:CPA1 family monovalent cation:H+ antiporter